MAFYRFCDFTCYNNDCKYAALRTKVFKILELTNKVKELRSEFVDRRSELMKLKMESTVSAKMEARGIFPSTVPPVKIEVEENKEKNFLEKLWQ